MKNIIKNIGIVIATAGFLTSCVNDTFYTPKFDDCVSPGLTKTKEVANLYTSAPTNGTTVAYPATAKDPVTDKEI